MSYSLKVDLDDANGNVAVTVREKDGGEFVTVDEGSFGMDGVHSDLIDKVALYGLSKLLQDRSSSVPTGPDKLAAMNDAYAQLASGQWEKERTRGAPTVSAEVEALSQLKGVSIPAIQKALRNYTAEQKEAIMGSELVQSKAAEIKAAREEQPDVSLDDLAAA